MYITEGIRTAPAIADLNADGFIDLAIGNYAGGLTLFKGKNPGPFGMEEHTGSVPQMIIFPNPARDKFQIRCNVSGEWNIRMIDSKGRVVEQIQAKAASEVALDAANLTPGLYYVLAINQRQPGAIVNGKILITR